MSLFWSCLKQIFGFEQEERRDNSVRVSSSSYPSLQSPPYHHVDPHVTCQSDSQATVPNRSLNNNNDNNRTSSAASKATFSVSRPTPSPPQPLSPYYHVDPHVACQSDSQATVPNRSLNNNNNNNRTSSAASKATFSVSRPTPSPPQPQSPCPSADPRAGSSDKSPPSFKRILSVDSTSNSRNQEGKTNYVLLQNQKDALPIYSIPKNIEALIKRDIVPGVLKEPLSPSTYKDYFSALLYAEDYYVEKWSDFQLIDVTLKLHKAAVHHKKRKDARFNVNEEKDEKIFIEIEVDSVPERRPFLLSRDFVFARPSGRIVDPFQGIVYRVVNSTIILVDFGVDFHIQYRSTQKYDVSFSFNRVCLKRAHQAITAVSDSLFEHFIFPKNFSRKSTTLAASPLLLSCSHELDMDQKSAIRQILSFQGFPPYILKGPLCISNVKQMSRTGVVIREAVVEIYRRSPSCRILICAPINNTSDMLMRSLKTEFPEREMFRANAAFREIDGVPLDILPSCLYAGECFTCPSLQGLTKYKVILSTFISSFRLHNEGIRAGYFSHIFMVDTSSATEPETLIALANFADEKTNVIVAGAPGNRSTWIRSNIARQHGLKVSYFERLCKSTPYRSLDPAFITQLS